MLTKKQKGLLLEELRHTYKAFSYYEYDKEGSESDMTELKGKVIGLIEAMKIVGALSGDWCLRIDRENRYTYIGNDEMQPLFLPYEEWQKQVE